MTTTQDAERECQICGESHAYRIVFSSNTSGPPDLDGRPSFSLRCDSLVGLERCPRCGYRDFFLSEKPMATVEAIEDDAYRQATEVTGPELAKDWHCWSVLCEMAGDSLGAADAELKAAWVCDDEVAVEAGRVFRESAIRHFKDYLEAGSPSPERRAQLLSVVIDLQRRSGNFGDAASMIETLALDGSDPGEGDLIRDILDLQSHLVHEEDGRRFTLDDVKQYSNSPEKWSRRQRRRDSGKPWWQFW